MAVDRRVELPEDFQGDNFVLALAQLHEDETLEAPLYGVWGPCLQKYLRAPVEGTDVLVNTYPQYPADLKYDDGEGEVDIRALNKERHTQWIFRGRTVSRSPSLASSPLSHLSVLPAALRTPPTGSYAPVESSNPGSLVLTFEADVSEAIGSLTNPSTNSAVATPPPKRQRATVVPDFTQKWYVTTENEDGKRECDSKGTVVLIMENKRHIRVRDWSYLEGRIADQTFRQARHIFSTSKTTKILGVIHALGYAWRYLEYIRSDVFKVPSAEEEADGTYKPATPSEHASTDNSDSFADQEGDRSHTSETHEVVPNWIKDLFKRKQYLNLIDDYEDTKAALAAIGAEFYYSMETRTCDPNDVDIEEGEEEEDDWDDEGDESANDSEGEHEEGDRESDAISYLDEEEGTHRRQEVVEDDENSDNAAVHPDYGSDEFELSIEADSVVWGPPTSAYDEAEDKEQPSSQDSSDGDKSGNYVPRGRG